MKWAEANGRDFPWRCKGVDPWSVLLAEILLARTGAARVGPLYEMLRARFPDPWVIHNTPLDQVESVISEARLGLHHQRAALLKQLCSALAEQYGGLVPEGIEALQDLPGVGKYIAHAVACLAWYREVPLVDANIARALARLTGLRPDKPDRRPRKAFWELAEASLPEGKARAFNLAILDFAALVCKSRRPLCPSCPLHDHCSYGMAAS